MEKEQMYRSLSLRKEYIQFRISPLVPNYDRFTLYIAKSKLSSASIMNCYHAYLLDKVWLKMTDLCGLLHPRKNYTRIHVSKLFYELLPELDPSVISLGVTLAISLYDPADIVSEFYSEKTASIRDLSRDFPDYKLE